MRYFLVLLLLCFTLGAQAEVLEDVVTSPTTFIVCKAVDVLSTYYLLQQGFVELNPLVSASLAHGFGPLIIASVLVWYLLKTQQDTTATTIVNLATCGAAIRNVLLIP